MNTHILDSIRKEACIYKTAVTLDILRKAMSRIKPKFLRGMVLSESGVVPKTQRWSKMFDEMGNVTHMPFAGIPKRVTKKSLQSADALVQAGAATKAQAKIIKDVARQYRGQVINAGDINNYLRSFPGMRVRKLTDPAARETFNRTFLMHEIAEAGRHPGTMKAFGHLSVKPMIQDLNIAATLKGPGAQAAGAIRDVRANELKYLTEMLPWVKKLRLGHNRVNRHMIKKIQRAYEDYMRKVPGMEEYIPYITVR